MWYILESEKDSKIFTGFREGVTKEIYEEALGTGTMAGLLNIETVEPVMLSLHRPEESMQLVPELFLLRSSRPPISHTGFLTGTGRTGKEKRELHTDLALDAIDFNCSRQKTEIDPVMNEPVNLVSCEYFNINIITSTK